ncbi:MAG: GNAT family N-acetyltransferase [Caulobacterales bacterium]|jgi:ribosomal-protein-alanine N-acetyltransferase
MTTPRRAGIEDAHELAALHAAAFAQPWSASDLAAFLSRPVCHAITTSNGFVLFDIADGESEILTLAVAAAARRTGIARALMQAAMGLAVAEGAQTMSLEVAADNAAALALYRDLGFGEIGRRRRYYQRPDGEMDALVLACRLPPPP